jgi:alpha-2-macroglobulin
VKLRTCLAIAVIAACGGNKDKSAKQGIAAPIKAIDKDAPEGLDLRLSDGKQGAPAYDASKLVPAKKLGDADVQALLARAEPLKTDPADQQAFALRPATQPAPRTGNVVKDSFPPSASSLLPPARTVDTGKDLKVLRWMPEGEVPIAPELSVTFSQPMVAVTSQDDAAATKPIKLSPQPKGHWRWIGTRTILFDPDVRFPQSTTYTVEVPAGTKSTNGGVLQQAHKFTFETPTIRLINHGPNDYTPQKLDVPIWVAFDQKIDAKAVFAAIKVKIPGPAMQRGQGSSDPWASGNPSGDLVSVPIRMLDAKEIENNRELKLMAEQAKKSEQDGRWIAFRTVNNLPKNTQVTVEIPAGTPSAEGPNKTKDAQSFTFHTYPPLELDEARCGYGDCRPNMPLTFYFNNPLDEKKFDEKLVTVSPAIDGMKVIAQGNAVAVLGATKSRTTYKISVGSGLTDDFAQTLGKTISHEFTIGDAQPMFYGPRGIVVLDPAATKRTFDFFSTNHDGFKVEIYKVTPSDLKAYGFWLQNQWNRDNPPPLPGRKVFDKVVKPTSTPNELVETNLDLSPALSADGFGHAIVFIEPADWKQPYRAPNIVAWVQATKLAVDAHVDGDNMQAFVTELDGGKPAGAVTVEMYPTRQTATTDQQGLATIALAATQQRGTYYLLAKRGNDTAFVSEDTYFDDYGSWYKQGRQRDVAWYVLDDRKLYKPGEEVSLKGWLRVVNYGKDGDVEGIAGAVTSVKFRVTDSRGNEIAKGNAPVTTVGGWDAKFKLPNTPNLGNATLSLESQGARVSYYTHQIQVEEFRRPEFEVSAQASAGPFLIGEGGDVTVAAKYFAGGVLPGAEVNWNVVTSPASFTPPNRDGYVFGNWQPWWGYRSWYEDEAVQATDVKRAPSSYGHAAKTDAGGEHVLHIDFLSVKPSVPMTVTAYATVMDVNRQAWSTSTSLVVHPASLYAGIKTKRAFVEKGKPFEVEVIAVDLDGTSQPGTKVTLQATRIDWEYKNGKYETKELEPQSCAVVAKADAVPCSFQTPKGGTYQLLATVVDAKGRTNQTKMTFWVAGGESRVPSRGVAQEQIQLIPDKQEYTPGNTAELMVQAPFYPAEGIVTWRRSGIVKTERITLTGPTTSLAIPITDTMTPNMYVQVDLVGMAARNNEHGDPDPSLPKRPAYAVGSINLPVPPKQRTLQVSAKPSVEKLGPGENATVTIEVKDAAGRPLADAEAAVIVVDESVLALANYTHPDPVGFFYPHRGADTRDYYERQYVQLANPVTTTRTATIPPGGGGGARYRNGNDKATAKISDAPEPVAAAAPMAVAEEAESGGQGTAMALDEGRMGKSDSSRAEGKYKMKKEASEGDGKDAYFARQQAIDLAKNAGVLGSTVAPDPTTPVAIRTNFNPLAAFSPAVKTGTDGKATVSVKMPDNLTRYRIVAVAVSGDKLFGKGESAITARLPLMVRPSPPRFLNFGDTFELPVVVQNQTDQPMTVRLAARAGNAAFTDGQGREVSVPANDRVEVRFPAKADMAGTARFQVIGAAGNASDAANLELPVWTPATTEAFGTYGVIDDGAVAQQIALPGKVWPQFGGLEVTTASTNLQALTDAVIYLVRYPFECAEQRSSRILAIAALRDVLAAFKSKELPSAAAMESSIDKDILRLTQMQNYDGGFTWWERGYPSDPYLTVFVTQALLKAKEKRFSINENMVRTAQSYLQNIEQHYPHWYPEDVRTSISAYALYVRKQMGDLDIAKGKRLLAERGGPDKIPMEANGWLLGLFAGNAAAATERAAIMRHAMNKVSETAGAANFTTSYSDGAHLLLSSDRRVDGIMLESLIQEQKNSDLIPKLVTGLLAHRKRGRWINTQENAFVLMALDLYFRTYEKTTPNFVARLWLGQDYAGDHAFRGRTTEYYQVDVAMKDVATHDKQNLTIQKDGAGRLYYRIGMKYAPEDLKLEAADYGFAVERRYEGVDNPKDVTRDKDGVWHVKAGSRIRVVLDMVNENRRYHVALVDPMPAGFEAMNPALATTGPLPLDPNVQQARGRYWWWYGPWYEHQNMRDERVEAFASMLYEGNHKYEYIARATTPGNFVVPPPKAEEMYMPETFGRGASDRVIVE